MNALPPPIQPQGPDDWDMPPDPAMDSLLREWLGEETPPNLLGNLDAIHDAARNQRAGTPLFTHEELVAIVQRAFQETEANARTKTLVRPAAKQRSLNYAQWGALAVAASLLGIIAVVPFWRSKQDAKPLADQNPNQVVAPTQQDRRSVADSPTPDIAQPNSSIASENTPNSQPMHSSPIKDTDPGDATNAIAQHTEPRSPGPDSPETRSPELRSSESRSLEIHSAQIVAVIDQQLEHMWSRLRLEPVRTSDVHSLEDRLALVLIGRLPTDAEREWGRKTGTSDSSIEPARALARRWVESEEFDRHWAIALSDYYLDRSVPVGDEASLAAFDAWLRESIAKNVAVGQIEGRLIGSDMSSEDPSGIWLRRWISAGEKSPGKLLASTGASPVGRGLDQWAALETLALQSSRLSGRPALPDGAIADETLPAESILGGAAAFATVFRTKNGESSDKGGFYVSDADGKVTFVTPVSPDGKSIANGGDPRKQLAKWFEDSPQARGQLVGFVWGRLVGQPLVPSLGLTEEEGLEERKDLLDFLANEAQSQQASLRQIVAWIAMSSPLYFESQSIKPQEILSLEHASLAAIHKRSKLFAAYRSTSDPVQMLDRFQSLAGWLKTSADGSSSAVLAQPAPVNNRARPQPPTQASDSQSSLSWNSDRVRFEIANLCPYDRVRQASAELANSSLEWDAVVERAFLACLSRYPSAQELKQASELLAWSHGDRQVASKRLLNALLGHP